MEKSELVVVAIPGPINPLKTTLGLSVIHSMPGAQCLVIATGRQTETFKITTAHASNRSTFSISRCVSGIVHCRMTHHDLTTLLMNDQ